MKQQNIFFSLDLSTEEINWLIESLEYYIEESETSENEIYHMELNKLLNKLLKRYGNRM
jgi:hypothetical protein